MNYLKLFLLLLIASFIEKPIWASAAMDHHGMSMPHESMDSSKINYLLEIKKIEKHQDKFNVFIQIMNKNTNAPLTLQDLKTVHTQKIHLLIIDESLTDYAHVHPLKTNIPGLFQFEWQPKFPERNYRAWADIVPKLSQQQEFLSANLLQNPSSSVKPSYKIKLDNSIDNYQLQLKIDSAKIIKGKPSVMSLTIYNKDKPVTNLEPIMGAFAHLVGFYDDFKTIVHIHPLENETTHSSLHGGPLLKFHIEPQKEGFIKLFAQFKINGKEFIVPFEIKVL